MFLYEKVFLITSLHFSFQVLFDIVELLKLELQEIGVMRLKTVHHLI